MCLTFSAVQFLLLLTVQLRWFDPSFPGLYYGLVLKAGGVTAQMSLRQI